MKTYKLYISIIFFSFIVFSPLTAPAQVGWTKTYENGAVVAAEQHAAEAGVRILREGGNAVDAAVAVQFALAVTLPRAGNIGGGGFMVVHLQNRTTTALDFREKAPKKAHKDMYVRNGQYIPDLSRESILASGVPGVVDGMVTVLERYGRLPLETVMTPAIELAGKGYRLSWKQAQTLNDHAEAFGNYDGSKKYYTRDDGQPFREGDLFIQEDLARTLERIARFGREGFYSGQTADLIVREMRRHGGLITYEDLKEYESVWRDPVTANYRGYRLYLMPPPSSGSIAITQMLEMLQPFNLKDLGFNSADYVHLLTETMRRAFADRAFFMGDPDFVNIPVRKLLSNDYNSVRMDNFDWNMATDSKSISHGAISGYSESSQTTHFSIIDRDGNAVAVTTTLNGSFGNHISVSGAGFLLNNEMDDFTAKPGEPNMFGLIQGKANAVEPEKRMLSSMTPAIITRNDSVSMVLGAAGGPRIITAILQNFLNIAVFDMNPMQAVSAPRIHHQWLPDELYYEEYGLSPDTRSMLEKRGHTLTPYGNVGRSHIIYVDKEGRLNGAADPRGDGEVKGY